MSKIYQLKITLKGSKPPIWRRVLINENATFFALHCLIQDAFNWYHCHLHGFDIFNKHSKSLYNAYTRLNFPGMMEAEFEGEDEYLDETSIHLSSYFCDTKKYSISYMYDFGDSWDHKIDLEKTLDVEKSVKYPQVIGGKRAAPWEDSGWLAGYEAKVDALLNPKHKEHREVVQWLEEIGEDSKNFDPSYFNPKDVQISNPKEELKRYQEDFV